MSELLNRIRESDIKPNPETEALVDALIEVVLKLNAVNELILDMIWHPENYEVNSNKPDKK